MNINTEQFPNLGFGLGLRIPHYQHIFENWPDINWFEIISENFMDTDGKAKRNLARIRERYPLVMHGVALSIGTIDPLNSEYLRKLKLLANEINPAWISDHLCWTGVAHKNTHDLLPVPYTEESLKHIVTRIEQVQDFLDRPIALENPSTYLEFTSSQMPESEFIATMAKESGCHLLLDVNNVYVSCYNHRLDPKAYIDALPLERVVQIHLSGHKNYGTHIIDTHDDHVVDDVWDLYKYTIKQAGRPINTMIEWDDHIPAWDVLYAELDKAKRAASDTSNLIDLPDFSEKNLSASSPTASSLELEQRRLQEVILQSAATGDQTYQWVREKDHFSPQEQVAIYINAYRYRLFDATAEDYPVLKRYLGEDLFNQMLHDFVNSIESDHFNIARYSRHLPEFLANHSIGDQFSYELAILENALCQLHDPEETIALQPNHLAGMSVDSFMQMRLMPRAALELFVFDFPVNSYYACASEITLLKPEPQKNFLAVFRHEDIVWRMELEENEYHLLKKIFSGMSIGQALNTTQSEFNCTEEELSKQLSIWFARWMRNGLLSYHQHHTDNPLRSNT